MPTLHMSPHNNLFDNPTLESAEVVPVDPNNRLKGVVLSDIFLENLEIEAGCYGTKVSEANYLSNVIDRIQDGSVIAQCLLIKFRGLGEKCCGVSLQFPAIYAHWDTKKKYFSYYNAIYDEDLIVRPKYSSLFHTWKNKPNNQLKLPDNLGLGTLFMREQMRLSSLSFGKSPAVAMIAEYGEGYDAPTALLNKFGSTSPEGASHYVYEFTNKSRALLCLEPNNPAHLFPDDLAQEEIKDHLSVFYNCFTVSTEEKYHGYNITAVFVKGISSFTGKPVVRTIIKSDGNLPLCEKKASSLQTTLPLPEVVRSIFMTGAKEIIERRWLQNGGSYAPRALSQPFQAMRIHASGEDRIVEILRTNLGVRIRKLGKYDMKCSEAVYDNVDRGVLNLENNPLRYESKRLYTIVSAGAGYSERWRMR